MLGFLALGFAYPLFYSLQFRLPNSRTLDGYYPLSKLVSNFIQQPVSAVSTVYVGVGCYTSGGVPPSLWLVIDDWSLAHALDRGSWNFIPANLDF